MFMNKIMSQTCLYNISYKKLLQQPVTTEGIWL